MVYLIIITLAMFLFRRDIYQNNKTMKNDDWKNICFRCCNIKIDKNSYKIEINKFFFFSNDFKIIPKIY